MDKALVTSSKRELKAGERSWERREERIEIHERLIVRTASGSLPALCEACSAGDAILLSPEQASTLTGIPARTIYQWVEAGAIHYREAANGKLIVCIKMLQTMSLHS